MNHKGPSCISEKEVERSCVESPEEAKKLIAAYKANADPKPGQAKTQQTIDSEEASPSVMGRGYSNLPKLMKQVVKYSDTHGTPTVLFYDERDLLAIHVPKDLKHVNDELMEIEIYTEHEKSTQDKPVKKADNHVAALTWHIIRAVKRHVKALKEKKKLEASKKPEAKKKLDAKKKADEKKKRAASPSTGRPSSSHRE